MWLLMINELLLLKTFLLQVFGVMFAFVLISARIEPLFASSYLAVFPVVMALTMPQQSFAREERGNTLAFLRALPIKPSGIVAAKYAVALLTVGGTLVSTLLCKWLVPGLGYSMAASNLIIVLMSFGFALSLLLHFWLGIKGAQGALLASTVVMSMAWVLLMKNIEAHDRYTALVESLVHRLGFSLAGTGLALLVGGSMLAISYAISARIFAARDLSRMP